MIRTGAPLFAAAVIFCVATAASAHEVWLEPLDYRVSQNSLVRAKALNGEDFEGIELVYSASAYSRSGIIGGNSRQPIRGKRGDRPAVSVPPAGPGLNIVFHASPVETITYPTLEKFQTFLEGKRLDAALDVHKAKGFPEEKIKEAYFRFVKALVAVGDGVGYDRPVGMPWELVALDNPYTSRGDIRIGLLLQGKPVPDAPVYVFRKADGQVEKLWLTTDAQGRISAPGKPGEYMVNAVHISEPSTALKDRTGAQWQTLWAALTYKVGD